MKKYLPFIAALLFAVAFARPHHLSSISLAENPGVVSDTGENILTVDPQQQFQTIHSFGASDCWTAKYAGAWKNLSKKNEIADLLFSQDMLPDGSPKGIGLSLWRFNIGAGSTAQGVASGIPDEYRREECFLGTDGKYNWSRQAGAQWFVTAAKKRGVRYLLGFTNAPPVQFSQNGFSYGLANNQYNLREDKFNAFADFLVTLCRHFQTMGTPMHYLSPVNEPQWKWGEHPSQEGSGATNEQITRLVKTLAPKLKAAGLATGIVVGEAGQINFLNGSDDNHTGNQLEHFFNPASADYLGNTPNVEKIISYHSYFSTCPDTALFAFRSAAANKRDQTDPGVALWQSEFGVLGSICGNLNGGPRHTDINYGLYVANVIHADLVVAGASSFQWWLAINPYDYSDGLVYINAPDGSINPTLSEENGIVSTSKQLWCMGNFSRFVRPGMKRIAASIQGPQASAAKVFVSAYSNTADKGLVLVVINNSAVAMPLRLSVPGIQTNTKLASYTSSATQNMQYAAVTGESLVAAPMSVTTFVTKNN